MRRFLLFIAVVLLAVDSMAQPATSDALFAHYSGREGYKTVIMGQKMLSMVQKKAAAKSNVIRKIRQIRILTSEVEDSVLISYAHRVAANGYDLISSTTNSNGEATGFYIDESDKEQKKFLMIAHRRGKEIIMDIIGSFEIKEITQLSDFGSAAEQ